MKNLHRFAIISLFAIACFPTAKGLRAETADPPRGENEQKKTIEPGNYDKLRVGEQDGGRTVVATNQILSPLGDQITFTSRPAAVALSPDRRWLGVLCHNKLLSIDLQTKEVKSGVSITGSFNGIVFSRDGKKLFASNLKGTIDVHAVGEDGKLETLPPIKLPKTADGKGGSPVPAGLTLDPAQDRLWAVLNMRNSVAEIDLADGRVLREIQVGNAPYGAVFAGGKLYVSNWAGRRPKKGEITEPSGSSAPPVKVDPRTHVAAEGSLTVVDLAQGKAVKEIVLGPHTSGLAVSPDGRYVCAANANADTVSVIDARRGAVAETISTRPAPDLLFGSAPNALAFSDDGKTLYVSNGTNNAVAAVAFDPPRSRMLGCLPTGWYPAGLAVDAKRGMLAVANVKGTGKQSSESTRQHKIKGKTVFGYNSRDHIGSVSLIPLPTAEDLPQHTATVLANNRLSVARLADLKPRKDARPLPAPERIGEPSPIKHVLYIIKENRTYDQVFGDMPQGEGDPELCIFGREITPNHHKLAEEFVLLDNFYCSGVCSADGHQWTDEAYVTDYLEKSFGGWPRSYPYWGGDAMAYSGGGFIWDNALARRKTLRIYGEFVTASIRWKDSTRKGRPSFLDCYRDYVDGTEKIEIRATAAIKTLQPYLCPTAIGFPGTVSDQHRAEQFLKELKEFERKGAMPNLMIMLLPNDHTSGTNPGMPTPEAMVADNDLALGRIVEALSRSKFWPETCILVVEDDPQAGFDHIDGHRTVGQVISPYSRRRGVDSTNYNQISMVRTIEQILGLPPMNQFDAAATPMASCFTDKPDLAPFEALKNNIPLDRMNPQVSDIKDPRQRRWAEVSLTLPLDDIDQADEDTLNRILWHSQRGRDDTYPAWAVNAEEEDEE
ncbi:MAG: bifunctional YncE family protein/alkaline phosphatase family protein [Pirellulales bacterium]|nr:bifunctional YncE family protein/alkaline phosphatase family protein [Pirellulales bacterium]